jgi:hypothetical protein
MSARHAGRPDHPDFWLLSQAILDLDAQADAGQKVNDLVGRFIDPESVIYAALQRGLRGEMIWRGRRVSREMIGAVWLEAFTVGMMVQQAIARRDSAQRDGAEPDDPRVTGA